MKRKKTIQTEFINLQTDFGFKLMFGSAKHKPILLRFLNALFHGEFKVIDVTFHDKEILPKTKEGKRILYDVYCTSETTREESPYFPDNQLSQEKRKLKTHHHFILEMQNIYTPPFEERLVHYTSQAISNQGKTGWDYTIEPVFTIAIVDFNFNHMKPKAIRDVMLCDKESGEILTDKIHLTICS
ncbi:MAG: Rpn family recombination-promoting nuclease/putative transposase, partial [Muribaculaceae bacterium]|nr:Rpn family recombination-promoting nuclease/putative transposase [Muribaculaceae bacterium]